MAFPLNKRQLTGSMIIGFLIGLPLAGMVAGFVSWAALQRRSEELAGDFSLTQAVMVVEPILAGEMLEVKKLAKRPVPLFVTSPNSVAPDEVEDLRGQEILIGFQPGDILLRSAFGLGPRPPPEEETPETQSE